MSIPGHELNQRINRLQKQLQAHDIAGALLVQRADLYYFSGTGQNAHLFIPAMGEAVLLVKKNLARARRESHLDAIFSMDSFTQLNAFVTEALRPGEKSAWRWTCCRPITIFATRKSWTALTR